MTLGGVKGLIRSELSADRSINETSFTVMVIRAMKMVCMNCVPLSLISSGMGGGEVLRFIDDVNYVRVPDVPTTDASILDIDDMLEDAVVYSTCSILSMNKKEDYRKMFSEAINRYQWAIYEGESNVLCK